MDSVSHPTPRTLRDAIAEVIRNERFGWVGDPRTLSPRSTTYPSVLSLADALLASFDIRPHNEPANVPPGMTAQEWDDWCESEGGTIPLPMRVPEDHIAQVTEIARVAADLAAATGQSYDAIVKALTSLIWPGGMTGQKLRALAVIVGERARGPYDVAALDAALTLDAWADAIAARDVGGDSPAGTEKS